MKTRNKTGFEQERGREYVLRRRVIDLEREMKVMMQRMTRLEKTYGCVNNREGCIEKRIQ